MLTCKRYNEHPKCFNVDTRNGKRPPPRNWRGEGFSNCRAFLVCMRLTSPDVRHTESRRQSTKQNQGTRSAVQLQPEDQATNQAHPIHMTVEVAVLW